MDARRVTAAAETVGFIACRSVTDAMATNREASRRPQLSPQAAAATWQLCAAARTPLARVEPG